MKAFISYSTIDKEIAGQAKTILEAHDIEAFLAHEDIEVSQEWRELIIVELRQANVFVPLLSKAFKNSDWAPQEIGFATAISEMLFVPISIDGTTPFGFLSKIQGKRIPATGLSSDLLVAPILNRFPKEMIPRLINRLSGARSFRSAESMMRPLVPFFERFAQEDIEKFAQISAENGQIWDAGECRADFLPQFLRLHKDRVPSPIRSELEYQIEHGRYRPKKPKLDDIDLDRTDDSLGFDDTTKV